MRDSYERIIAADAPSGLYESNYLKGNAPDGSGAFWLKHNVLTPAAGAVLPPVAEYWCVLWRDADGWVPRVWKRTVPLGDVSLSSHDVLDPSRRHRPRARTGRRCAGRDGGTGRLLGPVDP